MRRVVAAIAVALALLPLPGRAFLFHGGGAVSSGPVAPADTMAVADASGAGETNYPWGPRGHVFLEGAWPSGHCPQLVWRGSPLTTQVNVKNSYPDGSIEFAVVAAVLPSIPSSGSNNLTWQDTGAPCNNTPLTVAQMLDTGGSGHNYDFDSTITATYPALLANTNNIALATWNAVTDGGFSLTVNGTTIHVDHLNFSTDGTLAAVAARIQAALGGSVYTTYIDNYLGYMNGPNYFSVQTVTLGSGGAMSFASAPTGGSATDISTSSYLNWVSGAANIKHVATGGAVTTSARAELTTAASCSTTINSLCTLWTPGQVAQTIALADDTASRTYDFGVGDGFTPLRPRFYATFWPALNQVQIRAVVESASCCGSISQWEDVSYSGVITGGFASPTTIYTANLTGTNTAQNPPKVHWAGTAWSKTFWTGGSAPQIEVNINPNLAYMEWTHWISNYDTSVTISGARIATLYSDYYTSGPHDIYDGFDYDGGVPWHNATDGTGSDCHIGMMACAQLPYVYTGDWRMWQAMINQTDTGASWFFHARPINSTAVILRTDSPGTGTGRPWSIQNASGGAYTGPGSSRWPGYSIIAGYAASVPNPVGAYNVNGPWNFQFDTSHIPPIFYVPYILTGDPWYLDQMGMVTSFGAGMTGDPTVVAAPNGSGPKDSNGHPTYAGGPGFQLRGLGWSLRDRFAAALAWPDNDSTYKTYLYSLVNDQNALNDGWNNVGASSPYFGTVMYNYGSTFGDGNIDNYTLINSSPKTPPTLGITESNQGYAGDLVNCAPNLTTADSLWMQHYNTLALGEGREMGAADGFFIDNAAVIDTDIINSSGFPLLVGSYRIPTTDVSGLYYPNIAAWTASWANSFLTNSPTWGGTCFSGNLGVSLPVYYAAQIQPSAQGNNYYAYAQGAIAAEVDRGVAGAAASWAWILTNVYAPQIANGAYATDPKFDIVPRTDPVVLPPFPLTPQ